MKNGFIKVAAAAPVIRVCDCDYNADRVIECIEKADALGVKVLAFPALTLTGVECRDLFRHRVLLDGAEKALAKVVAGALRSRYHHLVPGAPGPRHRRGARPRSG